MSAYKMTRAEAFRVLGLSRDEDPERIRKRYIELMKQQHPDVAGPDPAVLRRVQLYTEAYGLLRADFGLHRPDSPIRDVNLPENPEAFTKRTIFMEDGIYGSTFWIDTGMRGRFLWDPEVETFSMLLKSVGKETDRIMEEHNIEKEQQAKLLHLLLQEFIDPYHAILSFVPLQDCRGEIQIFHIPCHLKSAGRTALPERCPVTVKGSRLLAGGPSGVLGTITFQDSAFHYITAPMLLHGSATAVFLPEDRNAGTPGGFFSGTLILSVDESRRQDRTRQINEEIRKLFY